MKTLHITQHPDTLPLLQKGFGSDEFLLWYDPLYEGPVPAVSMDQLAGIRAKYLAQSGRGPYDDALANFRTRNQQLRKFRKFERVILWFDHDMSAQLQLIQLLNWFSQQTLGNTRIYIVCTDRFPGIFRYQGLFMLKPKQLQLLAENPTPVLFHQLESARIVWAAFCSDDPRNLYSLLSVQFETMPYLKDAIIRLLDEYPSSLNGLSRTQQQILMAVNMGYQRIDTIFEILKRKEDRPFLTVSSLLHIANQLTRAQSPVVTGKRGKPLYDGRQSRIEVRLSKLTLHMTQLGKNVMFQHEDWIDHNGIDRWLGGVHIADGNIWRRSTSRRQLNRTYA